MHCCWSALKWCIGHHQIVQSARLAAAVCDLVSLGGGAFRGAKVAVKYRRKISDYVKITQRSWWIFWPLEMSLKLTFSKLVSEEKHYIHFRLSTQCNLDVLLLLAMPRIHTVSWFITHCVLTSNPKNIDFSIFSSDLLDFEVCLDLRSCFFAKV